MAAAVAYARSRVGDIAFAVRTPGRFYGYRPDHEEWSASVVKAMLLVTYLDSAPVRNRALTARDTSVLGPMIRVSDNDDAQIIFDTVGQAGLSALAQRVGMTGFATNPVWGETHITRATRRASSCTSTITWWRATAPTPCGCCAASRRQIAGGSASWPLPGLEAVLQGRLGVRDRPARTIRSCC